MVYLVTGPRGSGKTQQMIDLANEKVKTSNGNVVFIKKSHKDTYTVDFNIRVIRMADYPDVLTLEEFVGFLYGMAAGNHDIEAVFIDSVLKQANITLESLAAFLHKLNKISTENNIDFYLSISADKKDIPGIDSEYRIGYDLTKELLRTEKDLTAIVGLNDMIAFGIMDALQDMKYKVPGDVSVMGCDNTLFSKVKKVSLTTIEHFVVHKGMDACDIIMKKISSRDWKYTEFEPVSIYHVEYEPQIVVRGTTSYAKTK